MYSTEHCTGPSILNCPTPLNNFPVYIPSCSGWVEVQWDHGGVNSYRMGAEGKYDLDLTGEDPAIPPPPQEEGDSSSQDQDGTPEEEDVEFDEDVSRISCCCCLSTRMVYL